MQFLVDANVLSEPTKARPTAAVVDWLRIHKRDLVVNTIVVAELHSGILALPPGRRRTWLTQWVETGIAQLRFFDFDRETAVIWANLLTNLRRKGRAMPVTDSLIAASAIQHDLTVATCNTNHYRYSGVRIVNPFQP